MTKTPSDIPPDSAPAMATPLPPPPSQPGETQGIKTRAKTYPPPTIVALFPAPHGVDSAPCGINNAPIDSDGSATLLFPGTSAADQFLTPRWTAALRTAVLREIATPGVITKNSYEPLTATNASDDDEPPPTTMVAAPAPAPAFQVKGQSLVEILTKVNRRNFEHEQYLNSAFGDFVYGSTDKRITFEKEMLGKRIMFEDKMRGKSITFKEERQGKMAVVENIIHDQAEKLTGVSTKVTTRLDTAADNAARLSTLLEFNTTLLHRMQDNEEERTAQMVKHWERMDTLDALIIKASTSVTEAIQQT
jgi:hypothetical protein